MIYVDTNVLIAYINPRDELHGRASTLLTEYDYEELIISQLVVLELYTVFSRVMNISNAELEALVNYTIKKSNTKLIPIEWEALYSEAINYANKLKLRTPDLMHVVSAYILRTKAIMTFDKDIISKRSLINDLLNIEIIYQ